jgi:hypothetical protein
MKIGFDKDNKLAYPYEPLHTFSPPNEWEPGFISLVAQGKLSPFLPPEWCNSDVAAIPPLVEPPPSSCEAELRDLHSMVHLRRWHAQAIVDEGSGGSSHLLQFFLDALKAAGADLEQDISGQTARAWVQRLAQRAFSDASVVVMNQKALFNRPRPYQVSPSLIPLIDPLPRHASYPSGHSTQVHAMAFALQLALDGTRYPGVGAAFRDYAGAVARRREIAGLHYASDTVAGMRLATLIVEKYEQSADFRREYLDPVGRIAIQEPEI